MNRQCVFCLREDFLDFPRCADRLERFLCGRDIDRLGVCVWCDNWINSHIADYIGATRRDKDAGLVREFRAGMTDELAQTFALALLADNLFWRSKIKGFYNQNDLETGRKFIAPGAA